MTRARILLIAGSTRDGSFNQSLVSAATRKFNAAGADALPLSLQDYDMPLCDAGVSERGIPDAVTALHALFAAHDGIFLATPEYNSFPSPLLLNMIDWLSRVRHYEGGMIEAFERSVFGIGAASPSPIGGYRALMMLRQKLALGVGATVVPAMIAVSAAYQAFDAEGNLANEQDAQNLDKVVHQLLEAVRQRA
ncbi:NAD(P)H-dependent oxidoreductase [Novosphingobium sp. MMS21-SN21R]|uniref:NADPH-dependent FMN reductase n=1 Tax=Novosphingobium sp. MMS21-SN21R TaxID=2969298 RepID=UPI002888D28F|nr:NAD(P)H-dependent oxidoreductase [Novosphingobium sp. MMS21-SN21R]MDT0510264.1 NAD(P)H-dependent oxidoreductase [Novosphingobium sp. MMS21-SN21R]